MTAAVRGVYFEGDENILKLDGDGYTILWIHYNTELYILMGKVYGIKITSQVKNKV